MNIFQKQAIRRPYLTILLVLLLCTAIALSGVGYSAWNGARVQQEQIEDDYTTIVIPKDLIRDYDLFSPEFDHALQLQSWATFALQDCPYIKMVDHRAVLSAHIPGSVCLSSSRTNAVYYDSNADEEVYGLGVFALRCTSVEPFPEELTNYYYDEPFHGYTAEFDVEQIVCANDAYENRSPATTASILNGIHLRDGSIPFEVGKTYLVLGLAQYNPDFEGLNAFLLPYPLRQSASDDANMGYLELGKGTMDGKCYYYPLEEGLPWCTEYTGTVEEFLANPEAQRWNEEVFPLCRRGYESATLMLTDRIESIQTFHNSTNSLVEGRFFTQEEYDSGADVCIVSADYAVENGLKLGDTITMELYQGYTMLTSSNVTYLQRHVMLAENAIDLEKTYTIVGIYTGPVVQNDSYGFNADTIFAPKASVPHAEEYTTPHNAALNSYVLHNGTDTEMEAWLSSLTDKAPEGLGGQFLYLDQQYAAMKETLDILESNSLRLLLIGMLMLGIAGALFLYLNFRAITPIIRSVRLLGLPGKRVFREVLTVLLTQVVLAVVLGCLAAALLYDTMTQALFSAAIALNLNAIVTIGAVALVLLTASTVLCARSAVKRKLM